MRARNGFFAALAALSTAMPFAAWAGAPHNWQTGFIPPASKSMESIESFNDVLFVIISLITIFVLALLIYAMWRFSAKRNPVPSTRSHNALIEVIWTVVPILILVGIAIPSFKQLYFLGRIPANIDMTIKATGHQWYWSYQYPDNGGFGFDAFMIADDQIDKSKGQLRLLETDNIVVLPVDTNVRVIVTADDVIHSWAVPALGVKIDAVPGRINELWFRADRTGSFYGQCSELCGVNHGFMPIRIEVVSKEDFAKWVDGAKTKFAGAEAPSRVALAGQNN